MGHDRPWYRQYPRANIELDVTVEALGNRWQGKTVDLSLSGAKIGSLPQSLHLIPTMTVQVQFLPDDHTPPLCLPASVVRADADGLALKFETLGDPEFQCLRDLVGTFLRPEWHWLFHTGGGEKPPNGGRDKREEAGAPESAPILEDYREVSTPLPTCEEIAPDIRTLLWDSLRTTVSPVSRALRERPLTLAACCASLIVILAIFVLRGGGVSVPVSEPRQGYSVELLAEQAAALAARGDYERARGLYHQALKAAPGDVALWYALGVTLSHLNRPKETEEAFQYVVRQGRRDSDEVRLARLWLLRDGVKAERAVFASGSEPVDMTQGTAAVTGTITWRTPEPKGSAVRVQIFLEGLDGPAKGKGFAMRAALGETYRFERLPAGTYRLIGAFAGQHRWDLNLSVEDGTEVVLNLSKENSSDLPDPPASEQGSGGQR